MSFAPWYAEMTTLGKCIRGEKHGASRRMPAAVWLLLPVFCPIAAGLAPRSVAPPSDRPLARIVNPEVARYYRRFGTIVDESPATLKRKIPGLKAMIPAASQEPLAAILQNAGSRAEHYFHSLPDIICREDIDSWIRIPNGFSRETRERFNYMIVPVSHNGLITLREYRTNPQGKRYGLAAPPDRTMLTEGFAQAPQYLLPVNRAGTEFRYLGTDRFHGSDAQVVAFAQDPWKTAMWTTFQLPGGMHRLYMQGVFWLDPSSFQVLRAWHTMLAPRPDFGLTTETTDVIFAPVRFRGLPEPHWLPRRVTVNVVLNGVRYRNDGVYSRYNQFQVSTKVLP